MQLPSYTPLNPGAFPLPPAYECIFVQVDRKSGVWGQVFVLVVGVPVGWGTGWLGGWCSWLCELGWGGVALLGFTG